VPPGARDKRPGARLLPTARFQERRDESQTVARPGDRPGRLAGAGAPGAGGIRGRYYGNAWTGAYARGRTAYNPYTGGFYRGYSGYNPYTGRDYAGRTFYNPYTGNYGHASGFYNPYTGRYAYHYGYRY